MPGTANDFHFPNQADFLVAASETTQTFIHLIAAIEVAV